MKTPVKIQVLVNFRAKNKAYGTKLICWNSTKWKQTMHDLTEHFNSERAKLLEA